ncbi:guanine deaminase [Sneathiella sp.]|uniref:guanine deaminase n=1 Tax=Sneathiella sp. TaxID=1964365 RepID=UPI0030024FF0
MKTAIRGQILSFQGNPFTEPMEDCLYVEEDGLLVMENGYISEVGPAVDLLGTLASDTPIEVYQDALICPGFIDCHVHYPQTEIIGAYGAQLIDWLNKYTFVAEQKFSDKAHASQAAEIFLKETLRAGTTTASVFCTVDPTSVDAFFEKSEKLNMRNIAGKVLMDRNAPDGLLDSPQTGYDQTKDLIAKWHGRGRSLYSVTPRFAPTSSPEQMEMTGAVWQEHPGTYLQSHISENLGEIAWVADLYPDRNSYADVYRHYNQLGPRAIYGHGVHFSDDDFRLFSETGTALAHCPTSNLFLGSGLFSIETAMMGPNKVRTGLATDLGGGTNFSQLVSMNEAYKIAQLAGYALSAYHAFYLATRGAANALYLDDKIGSLAKGYEADIAVLDLKATPIIDYRLDYTQSLEETLFVLMMMGDDRANRATYVAGERVYFNDREAGKESFAEF